MLVKRPNKERDEDEVLVESESNEDLRKVHSKYLSQQAAHEEDDNSEIAKMITNNNIRLEEKFTHILNACGKDVITQVT